MVGTVVSLDEMTGTVYDSIDLSVVKVGVRLDVSEDETTSSGTTRSRSDVCLLNSSLLR